MSHPIVIPARGGSKGFPRKNLATLRGITLVGRAIMAARDASDEVWVSTDDEIIAACAKHHGASVLERPGYLADDETQNDEVWRYAWEQLGEPEIMAGLQCTAPLVTGADIRRCLDMATYGLAVLALPFHGVVWGISDDGFRVINRDGSTPVEGRQDVEDQWICHGSVWAWRGRFPTPWYAYEPVPVPADVPLFIDIDTPEDLLLLEGMWDGLADFRFKSAGAGDARNSA